MDEKVYRVFLGRIEEAAAMYERHRNEAWMNQLEKSQKALLRGFKEAYENGYNQGKKEETTSETT